MNPWLIGAIVGIVIVAISGATAALIELCKDKKTLFTGPQGSGKTTFLRYLSKEEIPEGPSGISRQYNVKGAFFNVATDMGGSDAFLSEFDILIKEHDFIFYFFDVYRYLNETEYQNQSNARVQFIHSHSTSDQTILLIGTHIDKLSENYVESINQKFAGKPYQSVLNKIVYIDTRNKKCVDTIVKELKK